MIPLKKKSSEAVGSGNKNADKNRLKEFVGNDCRCCNISSMCFYICYKVPFL